MRMLYVASRILRGTRPHTSSREGIGSRSVFTCRTPAQIISAAEDTKDGKTRPGQSQSCRSSQSISVWKCFVLPGVAPTATRTAPCWYLLAPTSTLITLLLPTFGNPTMPMVHGRPLAPPSAALYCDMLRDRSASSSCWRLSTRGAPDASLAPASSGASSALAPAPAGPLSPVVPAPLPSPSPSFSASAASAASPASPASSMLPSPSSAAGPAPAPASAASALARSSRTLSSMMLCSRCAEKKRQWRPRAVKYRCQRRRWSADR